MFRLGKTFARSIIVLMLAASVALGIGATAQAAWKTASNTEHYYSWTGIHVASLGVQGDYYSNGKKITSFSSLRAYPNTYVPLTTYSNVTTIWRNKTSTSGVATAEATWKMGVKTQWVEVTLQTFRDSVSATATR